MSLELKTGPVKQRDLKLGRVRIELADQGNMLSPWLRVPQRRAKGTQDLELPAEGEVIDALIVAGLDGVVLGASFTEDNPPPVTEGDVRMVKFPDGTVVSYDREHHKLLVDVKGTDAQVEVKAAKDVKVTAGGDVTVTATGKASVHAATVEAKADSLIKIDAPLISIAGGGPPVARMGDPVAGAGPIAKGSSKVLCGG